MSELWRKSLELLQRQFEGNSLRYPGLYCMLVETSERSRDRLEGPPPVLWRGDSPEIAFSTMGITGPDVRPLTPEEVEQANRGQPGEDFLYAVSDGKERELLGVRVPAVIRTSHFWGDSEARRHFKSLSASAWQTMLTAPPHVRALLPGELIEPELFRWRRTPSGGLFGIPSPGPPPPPDCWLRAVYHLAWQEPAGVPLRAPRCIWQGNGSLPFDPVQLKAIHESMGIEVPVAPDYFYSILGENGNPQDISLSSAFTLMLLLDAERAGSCDAPREFDVFVAYNSEDKAQVMEVVNQLKRRKLNPWIDEEQVPPGKPFQDAIQGVMTRARSAAIFLGPSGPGKWQAVEARALMSQCTQRGMSLIPVLLPGASSPPEQWLFLRELNWVRFMKTLDETNALDRLEWGITGERRYAKPD
ncbi:MAG: toll/interleukin-1 receptor domain-containing protein [Planctomycetes bacterium]|nr:toll/interleukin-1 receptor domain-containing protein [Planctomycetota bacterium]